MLLSVFRRIFMCVGRPECYEYLGLVVMDIFGISMCTSSPPTLPASPLKTPIHPLRNRHNRSGLITDHRRSLRHASWRSQG